MAENKKPKSLTKLAWLKRKAKELKGGEKTYISKKRQDEMKVARLIKRHEAKQAKKKPGKPKTTSETKPKESFTTIRTKAIESGLEYGGLSKQEIEKLRKK